MIVCATFRYSHFRITGEMPERGLLLCAVTHPVLLRLGRWRRWLKHAFASRQYHDVTIRSTSVFYSTQYNAIIKVH